MDLEQNDLGIGQRPALIVVDMINGFTDPACPLGSESSAVIHATKELLGEFRSRGWPIFFTTVMYDDESQAQIFRAKVPALNVLQAGSHWVEIDPQMERGSKEPLVHKHFASGFHGTDLHQNLQDLQVDSLVVTGLTTSGCVRATAVDGLQNDYRVIVASDAVGDRNLEAHHANLHDLAAKYGEVKTNVEVISLLNSIEQ